MDFKNTTTLDSNLLRETFESAVAGWPTDPLVVRVRWSRGAEFSGTCVYATHRLYINLGRQLRYPYRMETHCARGRKAWGRYYKPSSFLELCDGYQVCLFISPTSISIGWSRRPGETHHRKSRCATASPRGS